MKQHIFITGIDTEVGKTVAAAIAVEALEADYWKPIQSGELTHTDTHKVQKWVSTDKAEFYEESYRLTHPLSPHASAEMDGVLIDLAQIQRPQTINNLVIEGAGGLLVPLNHKDVIADLIKPNDKVILVTKHYLGSINHTLLSYNYLKNKGIKNIAIWLNGKENLKTEEALKAMTNAFFIERIDELAEVTPQQIKQQAGKVAESLSVFVEKE